MCVCVFNKYTLLSVVNRNKAEQTRRILTTFRLRAKRPICRSRASTSALRATLSTTVTTLSLLGPLEASGDPDTEQVFFREGHFLSAEQTPVSQLVAIFQRAESDLVLRGVSLLRESGKKGDAPSGSSVTKWRCCRMARPSLRSKRLGAQEGCEQRERTEGSIACIADAICTASNAWHCLHCSRRLHCK